MGSLSVDQIESVAVTMLKIHLPKDVSSSVTVSRELYMEARKVDGQGNIIKSEITKPIVWLQTSHSPEDMIRLMAYQLSESIKS